MAPQIDTAQQRAEALLRSLGIINTAGWEVGKERRIAYILEYAQQARREALAEAAKVAREFKGGFTLDVFSCKLISDKDGPWTLGTDIATAIDRLREGQ